MLDALLPDDVATAWGDPRDPAAPLLAEEEQAIAGAAAKRVREFAKGRECARAALARLGFRDQPVPVGPRREPVWPAGIVGSITHTKGFCGAAVSTLALHSGLGIDAEPALPLEIDLARRVCTAEELERFERLGWLDAGTLARLAFSAKESVYKCVHPRLRTFVGFDEVTIEPGEDGGFRALPAHARSRLGPVGPLAGRWMRRDGLLFTAVWTPAGDAR